MRAGWWRRLFQEAPLSGMHTPLLRQGSCPSPRLPLSLAARTAWRPRCSNPGALPPWCLHLAALCRCGWSPGTLGGVSEFVRGFKNKKVLKKKKKVWHQFLCLSDCPGLQQPGFLLVIGTAVFRWWAQSGEASSNPCHRVSSQDK